MSSAGLSLIIVFLCIEQRHVVQEVSGGCRQSHIAFVKLIPWRRATFAGVREVGGGGPFFFFFIPQRYFF